MPGREAAKALHALKQGKRSVLDYAIEFRTLAADSGWNQPALGSFYNGLLETLKDHLAPLDLPAELDALVSLASRIDKHLVERQRGHQYQETHHLPFSAAQHSQVASAETSSMKASSNDNSKPMQIGHTRLTPAERHRQLVEGRCIYCAQLGHFIASCPLKSSLPSQRSLVSVTNCKNQTKRGN